MPILKKRLSIHTYTSKPGLFSVEINLLLFPLYYIYCTLSLIIKHMWSHRFYESWWDLSSNLVTLILQMKIPKARKVKWLTYCTHVLTSTHLTSKSVLVLLLHNNSRLSAMRYKTLSIYIYIVKRGFITEVLSNILTSLVGDLHSHFMGFPLLL